MTMSQAFNEWMRRFIADPKAFESEFQAVAALQRGDGLYGREMAAYLRKLMREKKPSGVAQRVGRYLKEHPETKIVAVSGTLPKLSLHDLARFGASKKADHNAKARRRNKRRAKAAQKRRERR